MRIIMTKFHLREFAAQVPIDVRVDAIVALRDRGSLGTDVYTNGGKFEVKESIDAVRATMREACAADALGAMLGLAT